MSRIPPPKPGVSLHDWTVGWIRDGIVSVFKQKKDGQVFTDVRWQPDESFPTCVYHFDLLIGVPGKSYAVDSPQEAFGPKARFLTAINVVDHESFETDWYVRPGQLDTSGLYEYCLFDPTGAFMRPRLQALRKSDGGWKRVQSCRHGLFFSSGRFAFDCRGREPRIRPSGASYHEEQLLTTRIERSRANDAEQVAQLDERIRLLEYRIANPREPDDD
jgi:hypothetical protein